MKKLLVAVAVIAALSATPARSTLADEASTQTQHLDTLNEAIPITCAGLFSGVTLVDATGNGVEHLTVKGNGSWFTTTFTGEGTITMLPPGATYQGHVQSWTGVEENNQNGVQHATFNFQGTNVADPAQSLNVHAAFQMTVNADGTVTANHATVSCS
jgi:hypothetical protein